VSSQVIGFKSPCGNVSLGVVVRKLKNGNGAELVAYLVAHFTNAGKLWASKARAAMFRFGNESCFVTKPCMGCVAIF